MPKQLLTAREAAAYLRLSPVTLAKWRVAGGSDSPSFFKLGVRCYYDRADLDLFLERRRRGSTSDREAGVAPAAA